MLVWLTASKIFNFAAEDAQNIEAYLIKAFIILLAEKFLKSDWLRRGVF